MPTSYSCTWISKKKKLKEALKSSAWGFFFFFFFFGAWSLNASYCYLLLLSSNKLPNPIDSTPSISPKSNSLFCLSPSLLKCSNPHGTRCQEPTHETLPVTRPWRRKPDGQGRSGFRGFRKAAPGTHLKDNICLSSIDYSLISVTQAEGLPRSLPKEESI